MPEHVSIWFILFFSSIWNWFGFQMWEIFLLLSTAMSCCMLFVTTDTCEIQEFVRRSSARLDNRKRIQEYYLLSSCWRHETCKLLTAEIWEVLSMSKCSVIGAFWPRIFSYLYLFTLSSFSSSLFLEFSVISNWMGFEFTKPNGLS